MTGKTPRPTSPHLQIYRLPLTAIISISHRITGVALAIGLILILGLIYSLASGEGSYNTMQQWMSSWLGKLVYWGFVFALSFHLCHGIRHLIWDIGKSFALETLTKCAIIELIAAILLTLYLLLSWV